MGENIFSEESARNIAKRRLLVKPCGREIQTEFCCFPRGKKAEYGHKKKREGVLRVPSWPLCSRFISRLTQENSFLGPIFPQFSGFVRFLFCSWPRRDRNLRLAVILQGQPWDHHLFLTPASAADRGISSGVEASKPCEGCSLREAQISASFGGSLVWYGLAWGCGLACPWRPWPP